MTRWLVRFGYDGSGFKGWARQPGQRSVEGEILRGFQRGSSRTRRDEGPLELEVASRTDRGVSARSNALSLRSQLPALSVLRRLNGISPELFFTAITPIPPEFRIRGALRRVYRYFEPGPIVDPVRWTAAAASFHGSVDARSFGRGLPVGTPHWRTVESVEVTPWEAGLMVEVRAPSFVWGMVRKIVGALREHDRGRLPIEDLRAAVQGRKRCTLPMAEPEGLVLWDVEYRIRWELEWSGPNRHQLAFAAAANNALRVRSAVLGAILGR